MALEYFTTLGHIFEKACNKSFLAYMCSATWWIVKTITLMHRNNFLFVAVNVWFFFSAFCFQSTFPNWLDVLKYSKIGDPQTSYVCLWSSCSLAYFLSMAVEKCYFYFWVVSLKWSHILKPSPNNISLQTEEVVHTVAKLSWRVSYANSEVTIGRVFARVVLVRLQVLAECIYPESLCGFRSKRSTVDMIFSIWQLQEKCREQQMPLYIAFIDLTKAFDLVSKKGLFQLLKKIGCSPPPSAAQHHRFPSRGHARCCELRRENLWAFTIRSGVKQGCVLAQTLFGIFFSLLLNHAFKHYTEGIHLHTRSDGKLFNLAWLRAKTKVRTVLIREVVFADDAALATHKEEELQQLISQFSHTCKEFGLTISIRKTEVMGQDVPSPSSITIDNQVLEVVDHFTYLGSIISSNLSLDNEIDKHIAKAASVMARLSKRVWSNNQLTSNTKLQVYQACVLSTLLYGSESWTTYARQENRLESFHLHCLCHILGITWQDKVTNTVVLGCAGSHSIHLLLCQRRLRWLGHVHCMGDGRIPKDVLYGELATGHRPAGRPALRFTGCLQARS